MAIHLEQGSGVVNLLAGIVPFWYWGVMVASSSGAVARDRMVSVDDPACDPEDVAILAGCCLTVTWKPSPLAMTWWGRKVNGMSCHPNVTVHSWYLHMSAASAARAISKPLTCGSKDAATENMSKAPGMLGKTVTNPANRSNCNDWVMTRSMIRKLFLGDLGGSGWMTVTSNHSSGLIWSTQIELNCASQPWGGPINCRFLGAVHLLMVAWSMYHVLTGTSKSPSKMSYPIRKRRVDRSSTNAGCTGWFGLGAAWSFPSIWGRFERCAAYSAIGLSWSNLHDNGCMGMADWLINFRAGRGADLGWSNCADGVARHHGRAAGEANLYLHISCSRWPFITSVSGKFMVKRSQWCRHVAQTCGTWDVLSTMSFGYVLASWHKDWEGSWFRGRSTNWTAVSSSITTLVHTDWEKDTWRDRFFDAGIVAMVAGYATTLAKSVPKSCATLTARW